MSKTIDSAASANKKKAAKASLKDTAKPVVLLEPPKPELADWPKHHKLILSLIAVLLVAATGVSLFINAAHQSLAHIYLANTAIKADLNPTQMQKVAADSAKKYRLRLQYLDGQQKQYPLSATGIKVDAPATAKQTQNYLKNHFWQRLRWWQAIYIPLQTTTDEVVLKSFISRYATIADTPVQNASLSIDNGELSIIPDSPGKGSRLRRAETSIKDTAAQLSSQPLKLSSGTIAPSITVKDLSASQSKAERILSQQVVLNIAGHTITVSRAEIGSWVDLNQAPSTKSVDVTVNSGKVLAYINKVSRRYIQPPRNRLVANVEGGTIVIDSGANGVDVINKDQAAADIANKAQHGEGVSADLPVSYAAAKTTEVTPYPKWLVVDITSKRMYAYEDTSLVNSFLVSAGAPLTPTVTGQFKIYAKYASQDMRGDNVDGSQYFQPAVPYVNYFYRAYAIHGNYWRPQSYFGNINSSHGCVGIIPSDAQWVYNWAPIGTPVIVHS